MGIIESLVNLENDAVFVFNDLKFLVGQSDRDAADILAALFDEIGNEGVEYATIESILISQWLKAMIKNGFDATAEEMMKSPDARALWDAIFWLRFIASIRAGTEAGN